MFKRIKAIKNVGRFINCPNIKLEDIVLVYGPNCYGKSTISDIFRSLNTRDPEPISKRKSIGQNTSEPEVSLTFVVDQVVPEKEIIFTNNLWQQLESFDYQIEIFDTRFINDNVFTDLTIERQNKENLTNLILGEQGVSLAREIKDLKQKHLEKSKDIGDSEDLLKKQLGMLDLGLSLEDFVRTEKPVDIPAIKSRMFFLRETQRRLRKSIAEKEKILSIEIPQELIVPNCTLLIQEIKGLLQKDFRSLNDNAYKKLKEHIKKHIARPDGDEEAWIKSGVSSYLKNNGKEAEVASCPFCGQSLRPAQELIQTYQILFSREYGEFCEEIKSGLDEAYTQLEKLERSFEGVKVLIANNSTNLQRYGAYLDGGEISIIESVELKIENLKVVTSSLQVLISRAKEDICTKRQEKFQKPFLKIETTFNLEEIGERQSLLSSAFKQYNDSLKIVVSGLKELKKKSEKDELSIELDKIEKLLRDGQIKIRRHESSSDIDGLLLLRQDRERLGTKKDEKQKELEKNNSEFAKQYFEETTAIFNDLGSVGFKIEPSYIKRGGQPVFEPIIKFNGEEITDDKLPYLFSDADRRSLAFSIFLARLRKKSEGELKNTIVILDDPVTSYDDDRISKTWAEVKKIALSCRQLIVLAHHSRFLLGAYERLKNIAEAKVIFLEIKRDRDSSVFSICDAPEISLDPYAKEIENVQRFIGGAPEINATDVRRSLRPILQKELEWRYRIALRGIDYGGLGDLTNKLKEKGMIKPDLATKIYTFNDSLKDDHHDADQNTPEDTRSLARSILSFIFQELNPTTT